MRGIASRSRLRYARRHDPCAARSQAPPGNGLPARLRLASVCRRSDGRQSLPDRAFPGGGWERGGCMKVPVTGGAGYKGCSLVPKRLQAGYTVIAYDLMLFGDKGLRGDEDMT